MDFQNSRSRNSKNWPTVNVDYSRYRSCAKSTFQRRTTKDDEIVAQAMPFLPGKVLSPVNRAGKRMCATFQVGECTNKACAFEHRCAVVLQGGRACYGTHAAYKCYAEKAINPVLMPAMQVDVKPAEIIQPAGSRAEPPKNATRSSSRSNPARQEQALDDEDETPAGGKGMRNFIRDRSVSAGRSKTVTIKETPTSQKRKRHDVSETLKQSEVPDRGDKVRSEDNISNAAYFEAQSHWSSLFDGLAKKRQRRKGHSNNPEPPTLIGKMCKEGGELWLSGLPTEETFVSLFENRQFDLQVCCFAGSPMRKTSGKSNGILLPTALQITINMDAWAMHRTVEKQVLEHIQLIVLSLLCGNNVVVHCMAGCHRGGIIGAVLRAIIMRQSFDVARMAINQVRFVEIRKALAHYGPEEVEAQFFSELVKKGQEHIKTTVSVVSKGPNTHQPSAWGYSGVSERELVHAFTQDPQWSMGSAPRLIPLLCMINQRGQKAAYQGSTTTKDDQVAINWGKELCKDCARVLPARWRVKAGFGPEARKSMLLADPQIATIYNQYAIHQTK